MASPSTLEGRIGIPYPRNPHRPRSLTLSEPPPLSCDLAFPTVTGPAPLTGVPLCLADLEYIVMDPRPPALPAANPGWRPKRRVGRRPASPRGPNVPHTTRSVPTAGPACVRGGRGLVG